MVGTIIDGKHMADGIIEELKNISKDIPDMKLMIITTGDNFAGEAYVRSKVRRANELGIEVIRIHYDYLDLDAVNDIVTHLEENEYPPFIIQLPISGSMSRDSIYEIIQNSIPKDVFFSSIDVDGIISVDNIVYTYTPDYMGTNYKSRFCLPCTPIGVIKMLTAYVGSLKGMKVTILGRSELVSKPLEYFLIDRNCTVTMCHSATDIDTIKDSIKKSDIVISAMGNTHLLTPEFFTDINPSDKVLIDIGMNRGVHGELRGDCDPEIAKRFRLYTPVPGGVGPMTVAMLMCNVVKHYQGFETTQSAADIISRYPTRIAHK